MEEFDVIVIGSGPGGYIAAIRAAQLGKRVACVEKEETFGGTCLNVGCIPSKALLYASELYSNVKVKGSSLGILSEPLKFDYSAMTKHKESAVKHLTQGVDYLFKKNKVHSFKGLATFVDANRIEVKYKEQSQTLFGKAIILATGSQPIALPFLPFDEKNILSSTGALALKEPPKSLIIVGAGVIGLELGSVFARLGTKVTVIELFDRVCPTFDHTVSKALLPIFKKQGMNFHLSSKVINAEAKDGQYFVKIKPNEGSEQTLEAEKILVSIGRKPFVEGLGLEKIGLKTDSRGGIAVSDTFQTSIATIYAIGDLVDGPMLAHKASEEGVAVADHIAGLPFNLNYMTIPNVMYTNPEVAYVGLTEEEAREANLSIAVGSCPFKANPRGKCTLEEEGFVKILAEKESDRLIGLHIIGPHASEMIHEGVMAISKKMTVKEIGNACHAHPTFSEAIKEAALILHKESLNT